MKKIKFILSLTLILALALPLFIMPISAADKEPTIEELVELTRESEYFFLIFGQNYEDLAYYIPHGRHDEESVDEIQKQKAIEWGYYDPDFDPGDFDWPFSAVDLKTGVIYENIQMGRGLRFPDTVTVEKIREDIKKYWVCDFIKIIDDVEFSEHVIDSLAYLSPDGHVYSHFYGQAPHISEFTGRPDLETAKIKEKSNNKITLSFDKVSETERIEDGITIQYTKTERGWRISGTTGGYYYSWYDSLFAPEIPDTDDNSVIYIALAAVSFVALAGVTLVSAKRKKRSVV